MYGYDVDGVLTAGIVPEAPYVVISGREHNGPEDDDYIAELRKTAAVYLRPPSFECTNTGIGEWKSLVINILGVSRFFEDRPEQVKVIRALTRCEVVQV